MSSWEADLSQHPVDDEGLSIGTMDEILGKPIDSPGDFVPAVGLLRQAVALDSRMRLMSAVEAATHNPDTDLRNFRDTVRQDLDANASSLERLTATVQGLADQRVRVGYPHRPKTADAAQRMAAHLSRLSHALTTTPAALPVLNEQNRLVIEAQRRGDGTWTVKQPAADSV